MEQFWVSNSTTEKSEVQKDTHKAGYKTFYNPNPWKCHQRGNTPSKAHINGMFRDIKKTTTKPLYFDN